jgi:plasmid stability protein
MGQILIRALDEAVISALREKAAREGVSLEEEARRALARAVGLSRQDSLKRLDAVRAKIGFIAGPSSLLDLRADRRRKR